MIRRRQAGFTLLELMFGSVAAMIILVPTFELLWRASAWYSEIQSQIAVNRHARIAFDVLINGARSATAGNDGTTNLYGMDGFHTAPSSSFRSSYTFQYQSNNLTLTPDKFASMTVTCTSTSTPLPDCGFGNRSVTGWIGNDASIENKKRVIAGRTFEIEMSITDPFEAQRIANSAQATEKYRAIATLMRDESDP